MLFAWNSKCIIISTWNFPIINVTVVDAKAKDEKNNPNKIKKSLGFKFLL